MWKKFRCARLCTSFLFLDFIVAPVPNYENVHELSNFSQCFFFSFPLVVVNFRQIGMKVFISNGHFCSIERHIYLFLWLKSGMFLNHTLRFCLLNGLVSVYKCVCLCVSVFFFKCCHLPFYLWTNLFLLGFFAFWEAKIVSVAHEISNPWLLLY